MINQQKVQKAATGPLDVTSAKGLPTRACTRREPRPGTSNPFKSDDEMRRDDRHAMIYIMGVTLLIAGFGLLIA